MMITVTATATAARCGNLQSLASAAAVYIMHAIAPASAAARPGSLSSLMSPACGSSLLTHHHHHATHHSMTVQPRFEFLRKSSFSTHPVLGAGFRLKTAKIRGQLSQGLLLPLSAVLPAEGHGGTAKRPLGADLTAELGVRKWESVVTAAVDVAVGDWPPFLKKTDQPRVQNIAATLWDVSDGEDSHPSLADEAFEVTLKLDGSSCSVYHNKGETGVCSRNLLVWKGEGASDCRDGSGTKGAEPQLEAASTGRYALVGKPIAERLAALGRNLAIQGELMGPAIQGNREKLLKPTFFAFDIWDIDAQRHLPAPERRKLCSQLGIEHARVLHEALPLRKAYPSLEALLAYADSLPSMSHPIAEGIVAKSITRPDFSFKAISNRYLLKCEA